ncbi:K+ channel tetramerization domain-containing [Paramuricea clavata]|uniref:K+ channel tetramerization domain-containing n=1 Tax=Paramuricea clavata TaxID=317549 RepID=A0A7D9HDG0_PARCT|nr:K+ channel tetramerization domain-containing [Paramuricea clavata]
MDAGEVPNDVFIHLNVGGQKLISKRSTLCQVKDSFFASRFSGRWPEDRDKRDDDGAELFDDNPQFFVAIVNYLRAKKYATKENPALPPKVPKDQLDDFENFVEYLRLSDEIIPREKFNQHSPGVTLEEHSRVAVHDPDKAEHRYVLGQNIYREKTHSFRLELEMFKDHFWMFVGIMRNCVVPPNNKSRRWPGSYGWARGQRGQVWKDGSPTIDNALKNKTKQGDTVKLVLDCDAAKLSLHLSTGQQFHIEIPKSQTWRLHVNLLNPNDRLRIINE